MNCYFCQHNTKEIDFKQAEVLRKFISASGKIKSRKKTGVCASHQRTLTKAIKRARFMALLSPTSK